MSEQTQSDKNTKNVVYIVTKKFHSQHIEDLVNQFSNLQIPVQMHNDYDNLGVPLDRRYFVVVDNSEGAVSLGSWFTSLLLFIVGYPKKGNNKKNHYCVTSKQVADKYKIFNSLPEFTKKNYLSANIASKSILKSTRTFSLSKASQISSQSKRLQQLTEKSNVKKKANVVSQKSKLLMFFSQSDLTYNKWILKIAANNHKKYQIIESVEDLKLFLSVCRNKDNFLLITNKQYTINRIQETDIPIILYNKDGQAQVPQDSQKIIATCQTHKQIIYTLRQVGFQVVSLKDIDKSIVRYRNPLDKNKVKQNKKILWGNEKEEQNGDSCQKTIKKSDKPQSQYFIKLNNQTINEDNLTSSAPINCSFSSISKPESPSIKYEVSSTLSKQKKRTSIDNGMPQVQTDLTKRIMNQSQKLLSSLKGPIIYKTHENINKAIKQFKKKQVQPHSYITPVPLVEVPMHRSENEEICRLTESTVYNPSSVPPQYKQLRVKRVKSLNPQSKKQSENLVKQIKKNKINVPLKQESQKIVKQVQKINEDKKNVHEISISLSLGKQTLNQSKVSTTIKAKDNRSNSVLPFAEILKTNQKQKSEQSSKKSIIKKMDVFQLQDEKQNYSILELNKRMSDSTKSNSHSITYKMQLMTIQESFLRKKSQISKKNCKPIKICEQNCSNYVLMWKQFNYNIETSKNIIIDELKSKRLNHFSFYTPDQLLMTLKASNKPNILLFLDEVDIGSYFQAIQENLSNRNLILIYVFEKNHKIKKETLEKLKSILRIEMNQKVNIVIKPVRSNDYSDGNTQIAKQICSWFA